MTSFCTGQTLGFVLFQTDTDIDAFFFHCIQSFRFRHLPCTMSLKKGERDYRFGVDPGTECARRAGIAQWLERRTRDRKFPGSSPGRSGGRIFFSRVNFLCWLLLRYPFHPRVISVARKRSRSFCQKCMWQVTPKHTYTLPMWLWMKWHCNLVHAWMVYTELAPKRQHLTWHQPCNIHRALPVHHFVDINNTRYKRIRSLTQNHMPMCAVSLLESRE